MIALGAALLASRDRLDGAISRQARSTPGRQRRLRTRPRRQAKPPAAASATGPDRTRAARRRARVTSSSSARTGRAARDAQQLGRDAERGRARRRLAHGLEVLLVRQRRVLAARGSSSSDRPAAGSCSRRSAARPPRARSRAPPARRSGSTRTDSVPSTPGAPARLGRPERRGAAGAIEDLGHRLRPILRPEKPATLRECTKLTPLVQVGITIDTRPLRESATRAAGPGSRLKQERIGYGRSSR